jgi:signal transduction histidine kinase
VVWGWTVKGRTPGRLPRARFRRGLTYRMVLTGGVMAVLNIGAFLLLCVAIMGLNDAGAVARHSEAVLTAADRLEMLMFDLEMDSRGFILSGDQRFLHSYYVARAAFPGLSAELERVSPAEDADQGRRARQIVQADQVYLRDYSVPLMNTERKDHASARSRVVSGEGLKRLAVIRDQFTRFTDAQRKIAAGREQRSIRAARHASTTTVAAATSSLLLIWFSIAYLTRAVIRPIRRASAMAGELAHGDLAVRMPETSPGEIGTLERTFNTMARSLEASRDELRQVVEEQRALVEEQRALRRIATLVARGVPPSEVFAAVASEVGSVVGADHTNIVRYEPDNTATVVGYWSDPRAPRVMPPPLDGHWPVEDGTVTGAVLATGRPARITDYQHATSAVGIWARSMGIRCVAGCPVNVEGNIWGAMTMYSLVTEIPSGTEDRLFEFVELVGTAIANAQSRSDLLASRARVVAAADESRRRVERDLHDGAQQQLVTLGLKLCTAQTAVAPCQEELKKQLTSTIQGLTSVMENLHEISRGLIPAILTRGGLYPALRSLARRSPVPVHLDVHACRRLPEPLQVAIYYTVSEALTNVAKYAHASAVDVRLSVRDTTVRLSIHDDGLGGAHIGGGSGLVGLKDRIEALGGRFHIDSPVGGGTSLLSVIPVEHA